MKALVAVSALLISISSWAIAPPPNTIKVNNCGVNTVATSQVETVCFGELYVQLGAFFKTERVLTVKFKDGTSSWYRRQGELPGGTRGNTSVYTLDTADGVLISSLTVVPKVTRLTAPAVRLVGTTPDGHEISADIELLPVPEIAEVTE